MIISLKELNKFIPNIKLDLSIEKAINNLGYEVESITKFSKAEGIKFAKVLDVYKNKNSKNLNVVKLLTNSGEITIQTVAQNAQKNYFAVAFVENAKLGDIVFQAKEMAGIKSQGMLSGFPELGFDISKLPYNEDDLIMLKDKKITLDDDPIEYFELDDYIIDITTPANRADSNSYYVLAKELAAYYNSEFKWFAWDNLNSKSSFKSKIKVTKKEANSLSFIETKLDNNQSSLKDMLFLAKHNVEAKNNYAIDLSNINLLLTGAPTHSYDLDKIDNKITCEHYSGSVLILGNKEIEVNNVLAIKDSFKVISLACVMGLENTAVKKQSQNIAFEIGSFNASDVRHGAKEIKIDSASSLQGSRGVNHQMVINGIKYLQYRLHIDKHPYSNAVNLSKEKKGTSVLQNRKKLAIYSNGNYSNLKQFNGVEKTLTKLGFKFDKNRVIAPNYRSDISNYEDIIEEYFRFYGYDNFQAVAPYLEPFKVSQRNINKNLLASMNYHEVRTFTLINHENNYLNPFNFKDSIKLQTFVSKEREVIRNSIVTSLLEVAEYNLKRKIERINLFEHGMINNNYFVYGLVSNIKNFKEMKQNIVGLLKNNNLIFAPFKDNENIHPNVSAKILLNNKMIGWIGKIHPKRNKLDLLVAEFFDINFNKTKEFVEYNNEPLKSIDLTFELQIHENIDNFINLIKQEAQTFDIQVIDQYKKENTNNVTLRVYSDSENINKINKKFNN